MRVLACTHRLLSPSVVLWLQLFVLLVEHSLLSSAPCGSSLVGEGSWEGRLLCILVHPCWEQRMQMPGFDMPGLSFQEMPSMPASAAPSMGAPEYTVTSPPMSPPPPEMNHKVQKTEDYVPPTTQTAEATVLLKVKEGDEYKLALNMQQYSPEDITIKLNGNELTI